MGPILRARSLRAPPARPGPAAAGLSRSAPPRRDGQRHRPGVPGRHGPAARQPPADGGGHPRRHPHRGRGGGPGGREPAPPHRCRGRGGDGHRPGRARRGGGGGLPPRGTPGLRRGPARRPRAAGHRPRDLLAHRQPRLCLPGSGHPRSARHHPAVQPLPHLHRGGLVRQRAPERRQQRQGPRPLRRHRRSPGRRRVLRGGRRHLGHRTRPRHRGPRRALLPGPRRAPRAGPGLCPQLRRGHRGDRRLRRLSCSGDRRRAGRAGAARGHRPVS